MPLALENLQNIVHYPTFQNNIEVPTSMAAHIYTDALFPKLPNKVSPNDLAEDINSNIDGVGATIFIINEEGDVTYVTNKFILLGFSFNDQERIQRFDSFDFINLSFFGEGPKQYLFQGATVDYASSDPSNPGKHYHGSSLVTMYREVLRGTRLVEDRSVAVMKVMNHLIYGYPFSMQIGYSSGAGDKSCTFNMSWAVTNHRLALPGIISDEQLKSMYSVSETSKQHGYLMEINSFKNAINDIILIKYWQDGPAKTLYQNMGYTLFNMVAGGLIGSMTEAELTSFKDTFINQLKKFKTFIEKYMTDKIISAVITSVFSTNKILDEIVDNLLNNTLSLDKGDIALFNKIDEINTFLSQILRLYNTLSLIKARLIY